MENQIENKQAVNNFYLKSSTYKKIGDKLEPWNSSAEWPVKINSIRYNQDCTLFTLGTSLGYRIFSTKSLKLVQEVNEIIRNLGNLEIVMVYYNTPMIFFIGGEDNENFAKNELIIYDDYKRQKLGKIRIKNGIISNFYIGQKTIQIFDTFSKKLIIFEIFSLNIVKIYNNVNCNNKLISSNIFDFVAFTKINETKNIYIHLFTGKNKCINRVDNRIVISHFDWMQNLALSPTGQNIMVTSLLGNKLHIYFTQNGKLKECIYIGNSINSIVNLSFCGKKENYVILNCNDSKLICYKSKVDFVIFPSCTCYEYNDDELLNQNIQKKNESLSFLWFWQNTSEEKKPLEYNPHFYAEFQHGSYFCDFDRSENKSKEIVVITISGKYYKFQFTKTEEKNITPVQCIQWI